MGADPLYDAEGSARYLGGVSKYAIYAWSSRGLLKKTKVGTRTMFRESSLEDFVRRSNQAETEITARGRNRDSAQVAQSSTQNATSGKTRKAKRRNTVPAAKAQ